MVGTGSSCALGVFLAIVLMRQKQKNPKTNGVMGLLLLVLAASVALNSYLEIAIPAAYPFLRSLPEPFLLLIGPFFYEYIYRLSGDRHPIQRVFLHMLPFVLVAAGLVFMMTTAPKIEPNDLVHTVAVVWLAIYIHFWVYFFLNRQALHRYQNRLKATRSAMEGVYQSWINYCLNALLICYSVLGILFFLQHGHIFLPINRSLALILAAMIYCIGYRILVQPDLFTQTVGEANELTTDQTAEKYRKSGLRRETASNEREKVLHYMATHKPHIDPDLDLKKLADMLQLSPHHLSQVINREMETNFYDFVNGYRVDEAKGLLSDPSKRHLTVIQIAFDAGFNSKATFNRMFKKLTQQTPSQFRRNSARV